MTVNNCPGGDELGFFSISFGFIEIKWKSTAEQANSLIIHTQSCILTTLTRTQMQYTNVFGGQMERNRGVCHKPPTLFTSALVATQPLIFPT